MTTYDWTLVVVTAAGLAGCLVFVVAYLVRAGLGLFKNEAGRFMMLFQLNLAALLALILTNRVLGDWPGRETVTVALFVAYMIQAWWPARLLFRVDRRPWRRPETDDR